MIKGLEKFALPKLLGRLTADNHAEIPSFALAKAKNVILNDGGVQRVPGYTLIANLGISIERVFSFERQSDGKFFFFVCGGGQVILCDQDGAVVETFVTGGSNDFDIVQGRFAAYLANGNAMYTVVNEGVGADEIRAWGIEAPATAPTLAFGAGGLTLQYGRSYVYCFVAQWTDDQGVARYHIGPPSDFSAHTGPQEAQVITLGSLAVSANARVTHKWIFATEDSEFNTSATYSFAAEITNATVSWGDTLVDDDLDDTRLAPFQNYAPPIGGMLLEYEDRIAILYEDTVQFTANEEVDLGIPQESCPPTLRFKVPAGVKKLTGGCVFNKALYLSTLNFWFVVGGYSAETFVKRDKVGSPGAAGRKLILVTPTHILYLSRDRTLWAWQGVDTVPLPVNGGLAATGEDADELSNTSMNVDRLVNAELHLLVNGAYKFVVLAVASADSLTKNWIQLWDVTALLNAESDLPVETDMIPSHTIQTLAPANIDGVDYLVMGDADGNLFRWPDGEMFHDTNQVGVFETHWMLFNAPFVKKMKWVDLLTSRVDAKTLFTLYVAVSNALTRTPQFIEVPLGDVPEHGSEPDSSATRARLDIEGLARAKYVRFRIVFPQDAVFTAIDKIETAFVPLPGVNT